MGTSLSRQESVNKDTSYQYIFPINDVEVERMQACHHLFKSVFNGNFSSPIKEILKSGAVVLDFGSGPGTWITDMASDFPNSTFHGIEKSYILCEELKPSNVHVHNRNILEGLPFQDGNFDFLYLRLMCSSFTRTQWEEFVIKEVTRVLKPGGWIEIVEAPPFLFNCGTVGSSLIEATRKELEVNKIDPSIFLRFPELLKSEGNFEEIMSEEAMVPVGGWGGKTGEFTHGIYHKIFTLLGPNLMGHMKLGERQYFQKLQDFSTESTNANSNMIYLKFSQQTHAFFIFTTILFVISNLFHNHFVNNKLEPYHNVSNTVVENILKGHYFHSNLSEYLKVPQNYNFTKRAFKVPKPTPLKDLFKLKLLAEMAYYAHQTYCLLPESGFVEKDIYAWVTPSYESIQIKNGFQRAIIIQIKGRDLTYDRMRHWDYSGTNKIVKFGGFGIHYNLKVPWESYERYKRKLKDKVLNLLKKYLDNKNYTFLFTGHGEGGALAIYAAIDFWLITSKMFKKHKIEVTTFGAPRIGDAAFVRLISFPIQINRVTFGNDFVPLFLEKNFRHPNTEYWIPYDNCDCQDSEFGSYPLIYNCHMKVQTEHPKCNKKFRGEILINRSIVRQGPYFGYEMGKCRSKYKSYNDQSS
ncbi:hypothetical protein G9A89_018345 [Geosiphon pyriformis]|nr:hypothetical protein G9A89_018345 [Geosiphon pyriformis]